VRLDLRAGCRADDEQHETDDPYVLLDSHHSCPRTVQSLRVVEIVQALDDQIAGTHLFSRKL